MSKGPAKAKRGIPSKVDNFNDWYPFIVEASDLVDKRYPIKGMDVWRPYGWKTMRLIDSLTHKEMERTDHEEVNFPLLIPENLLEKENPTSLRGTEIINFYLKNKDEDFFKTLKDSEGNLFPSRSV